jgi:alpha-ribazole phosphatase
MLGDLSMLEIVFVRHGESEMNKERAYCGWTNSLLTKNGLEQAKLVGEKLSCEDIDLIISSDLDRCLKTADIINSFHKKNITTEPDFRELHFGSWEGLSYGRICRDFPQKSKEWEKDFINFKIPRGESLFDMHQRVNNAFDRMIARHKEGKILIVSHSGVVRSILSQRISGGIDAYWKFKIENCGITRLQIVDGFPIITAINQ